MPEGPRFTIDRMAEAEERRDWLRALAEFRPGYTLKEEGAASVYRANMLGRDVVVKVRELRTFKDRLKVLLGAGRGRRHWDGAAWLIAHGFATARPLVLAVESGGRAPREWLVMETVAGKSLLQHIADADLGVREQHALARAVGRQVSAMIKAGRFNRDHKPSNLIVRRVGEEFAVSIIDCVAIRPGKDGSIRMLHALAVEPTGLKMLPRRAILARVVESMVDADFAEQDPTEPAVRLAKWAVRRAFRDAVMESLRRHGDPTPRTNPLAPAPTANRPLR